MSDLRAVAVAAADAPSDVATPARPIVAPAPLPDGVERVAQETMRLMGDHRQRAPLLALPQRLALVAYVTYLEDDRDVLGDRLIARGRRENQIMKDLAGVRAEVLELERQRTQLLHVVHTLTDGLAAQLGCDPVTATVLARLEPAPAQGDAE